jgi:Outer membrane protein beta-barrel domain
LLYKLFVQNTIVHPLKKITLMKNVRIWSAGFALCLACFCHLNAQKLSVGLKAGGNMSKQLYGPSNNEIAKSIAEKIRLLPAFHAGLSLRSQMSEHLALNIEPMYILKGSRENLTTTPNLPPTNMRLQYLILPILLEYAPSKRFFLESGFELGTLLNAKAIIQAQKIDFNQVWDQKLDIGASIGAGYLFSPNFRFNVRLTQGLLNQLSITYTDLNGNELLPETRVFNGSIQAGFTYYLLGKTK